MVTVRLPVSVSGKKRESIKKKDVTASPSITTTTASEIHLCFNVNESPRAYAFFTFPITFSGLGR